ncbi:MAG: hypothetical protein ACI9BD_000083 [Candidatus Marinamargulisbacteria bacterium]|jgi:hypothetical protein
MNSIPPSSQKPPVLAPLPSSTTKIEEAPVVRKQESEQRKFVRKLGAVSIASVGAFPLWRDAARKQSGLVSSGDTARQRLHQSLKGPYKGMGATVSGMVFSRTMIFAGSSAVTPQIEAMGVTPVTAAGVSASVFSGIVSYTNHPIVRATIQLQSPDSPYANTWQALRGIYQSEGVAGLYRGVVPSAFKAMPKYGISLMAKKALETQHQLRHPAEPESLGFSGMKAAISGGLGAALTNPLDVLRNETFKPASLGKSYWKIGSDLFQKEGWGALTRGAGANIKATAIPIAASIFLIDVSEKLSYKEPSSNR